MSDRCRSGWIDGYRGGQLDLSPEGAELAQEHDHENGGRQLAGGKRHDHGADRGRCRLSRSDQHGQASLSADSSARCGGGRRVSDAGARSTRGGIVECKETAARIQVLHFDAQRVRSRGPCLLDIHGGLVAANKDDDSGGQLRKEQGKEDDGIDNQDPLDLVIRAPAAQQRDEHDKKAERRDGLEDLRRQEICVDRTKEFTNEWAL